MNKKFIYAIIALAILSLLLIVFSGKKNSNTDKSSQTIEKNVVQSPLVASTTPPDSKQDIATMGVKEFFVTGNNYSFVPSQIVVKKGDVVKINFKDGGGFHDLKIDEFGVATKKLKNDESDTITFVANKAGSFEYYCSVGNHRAMGMKGVLIVNE